MGIPLEELIEDDMPQKLKERLSTLNITKVIRHGECTAYVCDQYCRDKTQEEIDEILRRIGQKLYEPLKVAAMEDLKNGGAGRGVWYDVIEHE